MNVTTRTLLKRLERLEVHTGIRYEPPLILVNFVSSKGVVTCKLRFGPGSERQYLSADDKPISEEQAHLVCSNSTQPGI